MKKVLFLLILLCSLSYSQQLGNDIRLITDNALKDPQNQFIGIYYNINPIEKFAGINTGNATIDDFFNPTKSNDFTVYFLKSKTSGDKLTQGSDISFLLKVERNKEYNVTSKEWVTQKLSLTLTDFLAVDKAKVDQVKDKIYSELNTIKFDKFGVAPNIASTGADKIYNYYFIDDQDRNSGHMFSQLKGGMDFDVSPSKITFYYDQIYENAFGANKNKHYSVGLELSTQEKLMNSLPFQSNSLYAGVRFLPLGNKVDGIAGLDIRLYYKHNINFNNIIKNNVFYGLLYKNNEVNPNLTSLNSNSGLAADMYYFNDPFYINVYVSYSKKDFGKNHESILTADNLHKISYYSFLESALKLSFFWDFYNTHYMKMDIGAGYYDVHSALFSNSSNKMLASSKVINVISPIISFQYNLIIDKVGISSGNELLGLNLDYFAYRVKLGAWIKLIETSSFLTRFETFYVSGRLVGTENPWEDKGGIYLQLRGIF